MLNRNIKIISCNDISQFAAATSDFFINEVSRKENPLVVLPTGNSPLPFYREMVRRKKQGATLSDFTYLSLDEYVGVGLSDKRCFSSWIGREFLDHFNVPDSHRMLFNGDAVDEAQELTRFNGAFESRGEIDLAVIGIGSNGHVAFNEPGSDLDASAYIVDLAPETVAANSNYWGGEEHVPTRAYTLGLGQLRKAKRTLLIAFGKEKAEILCKALSSEPTSDVPASYLQSQPNVTVIATADALPQLG